MIRFSHLPTVLMLLAVVLGLVSSVSAQGGVTVTTDRSLALYSAPRVTFDTLDTVPEGTTLLAIGRSESLPTSAENDRSLLACSSDEISSISTILQEFSTDFVDLGDRIENATEAEMPDITVELNVLQVRWWSEIAPSVPNCAPANELLLMIGRLVDESMISLALTQAGYDDLAASHVEQVTVLSEELANRITELSATGPRAGRWEGSGSQTGFTNIEVSFTMTERGTITNFRFVMEVSGSGTCTLTPSDIGEITIAPDGSFTIALGPGSKIEGTIVNETTLSGTVTPLVLCGGQELTFSEAGEWTAEWQG
jgi:hypothetical protein